jgi:hypothetical protein
MTGAIVSASPPLPVAIGRPWPSAAAWYDRALPRRFAMKVFWHGDHTGGNESMGTGFMKGDVFTGLVYDSLP